MNETGNIELNSPLALKMEDCGAAGLTEAAELDGTSATGLICVEMNQKSLTFWFFVHIEVEVTFASLPAAPLPALPPLPGLIPRPPTSVELDFIVMICFLI